MKKTSKSFILFLLILAIAYAIPACKKNKEDCVYCTATCTGTTVSELDYCGEDASQQEAEYKEAHPTCTVICSN